MFLIFGFLFVSIRKTINFLFFFTIESIYFSFLTLIVINIKLIEKMLNLVNLQGLRFDNLIIAELYVFFRASSYEIIETIKHIQLLIIKNFIFYVVLKISALRFFSTFPNSITNLSVQNDILVTDFNFFDVVNNFFVDRFDSADLLNSIYDSELNDLERTQNILNYHIEDEVYFLFDLM